ncbi:MAG: T9SS type A sorting domain-containing protein [Bacteroidota bacterium]
MKKHFLLLILVFLSGANIQAQITRGASPGEIYLSGEWYADYDGLHYVILYSTDNGENLSVKYENLQSPLNGEMRVGKVMGDAAPGVVYNYDYLELWVSFNYGEDWEFREDAGYVRYYSGVNNGLIFKGNYQGFFKSTDYALTFDLLPITVTCPFTEVGYSEPEFFGISGEAGVGYYFYHSIDYGQSYTEIPIDSAVAFWQVSGKFPEISRGTQPGELYLISWWPNYKYKIFHSIDTGYTWVQKYEAPIDQYEYGVQYTAGRQPGSFYVKRATLDSMCNHVLLYIDYSSDYGETFTTYFHELDSLFTSVASKQKQTHRLTVFPNPANNKISIASGNWLPGETMISVINMKGEQVIQRNFQNQNPVEMDVSMLPKGIYLVKMQTRAGIETEKLEIH